MPDKNFLSCNSVLVPRVYCICSETATISAINGLALVFPGWIVMMIAKMKYSVADTAFLVMWSE